MCMCLCVVYGVRLHVSIGLHGTIQCALDWDMVHGARLAIFGVETEVMLKLVVSMDNFG